MSRSYKFDIASNSSREIMRINGVEFYVRQMSIAEQLRLQAARDRVHKQRRRHANQVLAQQAQIRAGADADSLPELPEPPVMVEVETAELVPVLRRLVVNELDMEKVTPEWLMELSQEAYGQVFSVLLTGEMPSTEDMGLQATGPDEDTEATSPNQ